LNSKSTLLARAFLAASLAVAVPAVHAQQQQPQQAQQPDTDADKCRWWQQIFGRCQDIVEGLPADAPRTGTVITVDVSTNTLYLFQDGQLIEKSAAATGNGKMLKNGHKVWAFHTPRGHLKVLRKMVDPVWRKPDWAFVENGDPVPPPDSPKRYVKGHLGKYALDLGDGILIHGTDDPDSIGKYASHGCIRLPEDALETVYRSAKVGTDVYVFDSNPPQTAASNGKAERHSDLD
jgi:L,D-transpeptidase ErfK/SrfK